MVVLARGKSGGEVEPNPSRTAKSVHAPVTIVAGKVYVHQIRTKDYCFIILGSGSSGTFLEKYGGGFFLLECYRVLWPKHVFLNVYGAQESIPRNEFRQPMYPGRPVRYPYSYSVPSPRRLFKNSSSALDMSFCSWSFYLVFPG
jgi:hypothetical protein